MQVDLTYHVPSLSLNYKEHINRTKKMPVLTDNIVAGPAGHVQAAPAATFSAGPAGSTVPGPAGHVEITPATQGIRSLDATVAFEVEDATMGYVSPDVTQGIVPELRVGVVVHHTA